MTEQKPSWRDGLTGKQQRFVEEYLVDLNASAAARRAGYSEGSAADIGYENLMKPEIAAAIAAAKAERSKRLEVTQDRIVEELAELGYSNLADFVDVEGGEPRAKDWESIPTEKKRAVSEITFETSGSGKDAKTRVKLKLHDKKVPLITLGKHLGLFADNLNLNVTEGVANRLAQAREARRRREQEAEGERVVGGSGDWRTHGDEVGEPRATGSSEAEGAGERKDGEEK